MENIKFQYSNKRNWVYLLLGSVWFVIGILNIYFNEESNFNSSWVIFGLVYIGLYFFNKNKNYIEFDGNYLIAHLSFGKKISINEITRVKFFANEYTVFSGTKKIVIPLEGLEEEPKSKLKSLMKEFQTGLELKLV